MKNKKLQEIYRSYMSYCDSNNRAFYIKDNFIDFVDREKLGYNAYELDIYFNKMLNMAKDHTTRLLPQGNNSDEQIAITRRKRHPIRDIGAKKVGVPAVAVAIGSAITYGAIMAANMVAGTGLLIPVTANTAMNILSTASVGLMGGLLLTPAIIATKNAITKKYYSAKYGNVSKILKKLNKQHAKALKKAKTQEEKNKLIAEHATIRYEKLAAAIDTKLEKLESKISQSNDRVLALRTGSKWTAPFRAFARTAINIVNRNRIHHIQKCANDLMVECLGGKPNSQQNVKLISKMIEARNANPIYASLIKINDFVTSEIEKSKTYALNNKKDKNLIENIDIYANMAIELQDIKRPKKMSKRDHVDNVAKELFFGKNTVLGDQSSSLEDQNLPEPLTTVIDVKKKSEPKLEGEVTPDNKKDSTVDQKDPLIIDIFSRSGFDKVIYEKKDEKSSSDAELELTKILEDYKKDNENTPLDPISISNINKTIDEINKERGYNIPHYEDIATFDNLTFNDEDEKHSESDDIKIDTTTPPHYEEDEEESKSNNNNTPIVTEIPATDTKKETKAEPNKENLITKIVIKKMKTKYSICVGDKRFDVTFKDGRKTKTEDQIDNEIYNIIAKETGFLMP